MIIMIIRDKEKIDKIVSTLNLKVNPRDLASRDNKQVMQGTFFILSSYHHSSTFHHFIYSIKFIRLLMS